MRLDHDRWQHHVLYAVRENGSRQSDNCKILRVKKKPNGQWDVPEELPASINTGNSQTPRIMADGETLVFASNKMAGGKGGMDLYLTRFTNNTWSNPVPLDFVNTDKDDQYVSAAGLGRYLKITGARESIIKCSFLMNFGPRA